MNRRRFLRKLASLLLALGVPAGFTRRPAAAAHNGKNGGKPFYGMGVDIDKCIGCAKCMEACKIENEVPAEPFFFRTWVERYVIKRDGSVAVQSIGTATNPSAEAVSEKEILRSFFVPKLCNQCANPACVQVCPVGATFQTEDGVVLVDDKRCIGCRYCIQACPYGARYLHPEKKTADKCTFCYHRISKGLLPACVEVCPTQARVFGDVNSVASPLARLKRMNKVHVLKPHLNTEPKVYYANLDGEVK
ncbi:MAG: 4Fe-4S dicluster domain-containing protein [Deltaproteobacteria bacterium]|nr:4Fe-4S dicluster domain-containing protein [Deltaproteobacteria bacterium]